MRARHQAVGKASLFACKTPGFGASLEVRKLYAFVDDPDAEANDLIRVVDEFGEDYLYPASMFRRLALPSDVQRALRLAS